MLHMKTSGLVKETYLFDLLDKYMIEEKIKDNQLEKSCLQSAGRVDLS